jgi:hypothetical protein
VSVLVQPRQVRQALYGVQLISPPQSAPIVAAKAKEATPALGPPRAGHPHSCLTGCLDDAPRLAGGDRRRLRVLSTTEVLVGNAHGGRRERARSQSPGRNADPAGLTARAWPARHGNCFTT